MPAVSQANQHLLNISDHSRDSAGLRYIYPVISRRAGGVSIGINLNVNNACNWACIYCQVPNLTRGGPPPVDLVLLEKELRDFLHEAVDGDFMAQHVPLEARRLADIAFSGNGEPTSAVEFPATVEMVGKVLAQFGLLEQLKIRLITNGSLLYRPEVREGIRRIGELDGEIWFKVDRATSDGIRQVNGVNLSVEAVRGSLEKCSALAPTWVQTCFFAIDGEPPSDAERAAYLSLIGTVQGRIQGVHLYGLARPSLQPEAYRLSTVNPETLTAFAASIATLGVRVETSP
ncbi:MAG: radical SAM protein [Nitrosomonadales bacterium]|nr:MAG: radical SAM protein [Nitrosomonadales bacterium]